MARHFPSRYRACAAAALAGAMLAGCTADNGGPALDATATESARRFSEEIGALALNAQERIQVGEYSAADALLDEALAMGPSPFERFTLLQMRGQTAYGLGDTPGAIRDWRAALATGVATPREESSLSLNIGQLQIVSGEVEAGVEQVETWLRTNEPQESVVMTLAQALASEGEPSRALPYADQAFRLAEPPERKHYDLLVFLYNELGMETERTGLLAERMARFPTDSLD